MSPAHQPHKYSSSKRLFPPELLLRCLSFQAVLCRLTAHFTHQFDGGETQRAMGGNEFVFLWWFLRELTSRRTKTRLCSGEEWWLCVVGSVNWRWPQLPHVRPASPIRSLMLQLHPSGHTRHIHKQQVGRLTPPVLPLEVLIEIWRDNEDGKHQAVTAADEEVLAPEKHWPDEN